MDAAALQGRQRRVLAIVLGINVATFAMMVAGTWLSGASSLLSGTLDNFGDALTYGLSFAAVGKSARTKAGVALFKGCLIMTAAGAVAVHIGYHLLHPAEIVVTTMGGVALLNLAANGVCLWLLTPHRRDDVNMSSVWECSRNDIYEGSAVIVTAALVFAFDSAWPDLLVAAALLVLFTRSALRVLTGAWADLKRSEDEPACGT